MNIRKLLAKGIVSDLLLNIASVILSTAVLQLIALPIAAKKLSAEEYGVMLSMASVFQLVSGTVANALNNVRLLNREKNYGGAYNVLAIVSLVLVSLITLGYSIYKQITVEPLMLALIVMVAIFFFLQDYWSVYYRLRLNYKLVFLSSVIGAALYLLGVGMLNVICAWPLVYLFAYLGSSALSCWYGKPWKEGLKCSGSLAELSGQTGILMASKFMSRIMSFADKIVLYGLLGGASVTIYYVASLLGKCLSMVITPINNVVLSYLCAGDKKKSRMFYYTLWIGLLVCALFYVAAWVIEKPFLQLLYPDYANEAMRYILITNATALMMTLVSMLEPFILRFCKLRLQLILNGSVSVLYLALTVLLGKSFDLMGFCIACLVAYVIRCLMVVIMYITKSEKTITGENCDG